MQGQNVFAPGVPGYTMPVGRPKDWFHYPLRFTAIANTDVDTLSVSVDAGSDFFLTALTFFATISGSTAGLTVATNVVPIVTLLITDSGSNRQLMQNPVPLPLLAGDGNHPHRLIYPRLFLRNSNIQVQMASSDPVTYGNIWVNFEGFRVYGA